MKYLLDTNILIYLCKGTYPAIAEHIRTFGPGDVVISSITLAELEFGILKSAKPEKNRKHFQEFLLPFEILPFDAGAAVEYGAVRHYLEKSGSPIGPLDTLIAAQARAAGVCLVTNNEREFNRVPELKVENWCKPGFGG
ncbi:MAG: type II toxin-antitoxin system VapC family toxin [Erysipelotrichia bacterium]|nr:type II toxin-antitoxin system VapC family toxin [Erysipelotrichia bacterium]